MKPLILLVAVVSFAVFASAQTAVAPTVVKANSVEKRDNTLQFRGSVRIVFGNYVITADEADGHLRGPDARGDVPDDFDLRGNVHLTTSFVR